MAGLTNERMHEELNHVYEQIKDIHKQQNINYKDKTDKHCCAGMYVCMYVCVCVYVYTCVYTMHMHILFVFKFLVLEL